MGKKRNIVLTLDYEIFGNGTGDVRQHVTGPTERICRIAERHGVPVTIFFELEECLQFQRHATELRNTCGYDPGEEMRRQASDLARRGHDILLHLHPQWHRARYDRLKWILEQTCLTVDSLFETQEETAQYIRERQAALQEIAGKPVVAYRAGGFAAQPAAKLLRALDAAGFAIDSSVVHGLHFERPCPVDYREAPAGRRLWRISDAVDREDRDGNIWEIPIHAIRGRRYRQLTVQRLKAKFSRNVPKARQREIIDQFGMGRNPAGALSFLWQPVPIKADYHNLSASGLHRMIRDNAPPCARDFDVLVLIGHSKEHADDLAFERFLQLVTADSSLRIISLTELADQLRSVGPAGLAA